VFVFYFRFSNHSRKLGVVDDMNYDDDEGKVSNIKCNGFLVMTI
jgi:hypothetical protein